MSRRTSSELITPEARAMAIEMWTETRETNWTICQATGLSIERIKNICADLERPAPAVKLSDAEVTGLLMGFGR